MEAQDHPHNLTPDQTIQHSRFAAVRRDAQKRLNHSASKSMGLGKNPSCSDTLGMNIESLPRRIARPTLVRRLLPILCLATCAGATQLPPPSLSPDPQTTATTLRLARERGGEKVWIYFRDKEHVDPPAYRERLRAARASLPLRSHLRRAKVLGPELVDFHDLPVPRAYLTRLEELGAEVVWPSRWLNAASVRAPVEVLQRIARLPFVQRLEPVRRGRRAELRLVSGAARLDIAEGRWYEYDYGNSQGQLDEIRVPEAHQRGWTGAGVIVAMLDTGYWREHPAFENIISSGRLLAQWDFVNNDPETGNEPGDDEGQHFHGTVTWSVLAGFAPKQLIGPAFGADFLLAKTEDVTAELPIEEDNWVAAAEWADQQGADIISSSLAYIDWYEYSDMDGNTATTTIGADIAASRGIVVCSAAGNYGTQDWYYIGAPADGDEVITVGAMRPGGEMWVDSSHGPTYDGRTKPEVVARGDETFCAIPPGFGHGAPDSIYWSISGTSVSTPLVAGAAALLLEAHPDWTPAMVRGALKLTADNADNPDNHRGWGLIDVVEAMRLGEARD